jgi:hypothetical protein
MNAEYWMAVKSIGLSKLGGRKPCTLSGAAKHNKRELAQELEERGRIDPQRTRLNYSIAGATDSAGVLAMASQLMASIGVSPEKMRRDYCQAIEIIFSLPANTTIEIERYFSDCFEWCCTRFGVENILSADVHLDESTPHCHALIAPIQSGRWVGGMPINRTNTKVMNESFLKQVASVYGLKMGGKLTGKRKGEAVAKLLGHIETHDRGLFQSLAWPPLRHAIEHNPAPFLTAYGIELENKPPTNLKTTAQIFTSVGKGAKRETLHLPKPKRNPLGIASEVNKPAQANPIGIQNKGGKNQSLSCVGIASFQNSISPAYGHNREGHCFRETEFSLASCDPATGELLQAPHIPKQHQRNS